MQSAARQVRFDSEIEQDHSSHVDRSSLKKFYFGVNFITLVGVAFTVAVDQLFLKGAVQEIATLGAVRNYFFALVFGMPHIIASLMIYSMPSYFTMYRTKMVGAVSASLLLSLLSVSLVSSLVWDAFFWVFTFIHAVGQQLGIRRLVTKGDNPRFYNVWKHSLTLLAVLVFFNLISYFERHQIHMVLSPAFWMAAAGALCIAAYFFIFRTSSKEIRAYEALNLSLYLGAGLMVWFSYPFLAVILLRVTHDVLAFYFYVSHNMRKSRENQKFPALLSERRRDLVIAGFSLFAPVFIYWALKSLSLSFIGTVFIFLSLCHYFIEGFFWKKSARAISYVA